MPWHSPLSAPPPSQPFHDDPRLLLLKHISSAPDQQSRLTGYQDVLTEIIQEGQEAEDNCAQKVSAAWQHILSHETDSPEFQTWRNKVAETLSIHEQLDRYHKYSTRKNDGLARIEKEWGTDLDNALADLKPPSGWTGNLIGSIAALARRHGMHDARPALAAEVKGRANTPAGEGYTGMSRSPWLQTSDVKNVGLKLSARTRQITQEPQDRRKAIDHASSEEDNRLAGVSLRKRRKVRHGGNAYCPPHQRTSRSPSSVTAEASRPEKKSSTTGADNVSEDSDGPELICGVQNEVDNGEGRERILSPVSHLSEGISSDVSIEIARGELSKKDATTQDADADDGMPICDSLSFTTFLSPKPDYTALALQEPSDLSLDTTVVGIRRAPDEIRPPRRQTRETRRELLGRFRPATPDSHDQILPIPTTPKLIDLTAVNRLHVGSPPHTSARRSEKAADSLQPQQDLASDALHLVFEAIASQNDGCFIFDSLWYNIEAEHPRQIQLPSSALGCRTAFLPLHHRTNHHWTLAMLDLTAYEIHYYDSMPSKPAGHHERIASRLIKSLDGIKANDSNYPNPWTFIHEDAAVQPNCFDCGIYVLVNAYYLISGLSVPTAVDGAIWRKVFRLLVCGEEIAANDWALSDENFHRHITADTIEASSHLDPFLAAVHPVLERLNAANHRLATAKAQECKWSAVCAQLQQACAVSQKRKSHLEDEAAELNHEHQFLRETCNAYNVRVKACFKPHLADELRSSMDECDKNLKALEQDLASRQGRLQSSERALAHARRAERDAKEAGARAVSERQEAQEGRKKLQASLQEALRRLDSGGNTPS